MGGHPSFAEARKVFYTDFDAVIIVYDCAASHRSQGAASKTPEMRWVDEMTAACCGSVADQSIESGNLEERRAGHSGWLQLLTGAVPLLVVANKVDLFLDIGHDHVVEKNSGRRDDAVFTSAIDSHLDTREFHNFFLGAYEHKLTQGCGGSDEFKHRSHICGSVKHQWAAFTSDGEVRAENFPRPHSYGGSSVAEKFPSNTDGGGGGDDPHISSTGSSLGPLYSTATARPRRRSESHARCESSPPPAPMIAPASPPSVSGTRNSSKCELPPRPVAIHNPGTPPALRGKFAAAFSPGTNKSQRREAGKDM